MTIDTDSVFTLRCFGSSLEARIAGSPMRSLRSKKGEWLLALLVLRHGRPVSREWLADQLWPDSGADDWGRNLRQSLWDLRQALGGQSWRISAPSRHKILLDLSGADVDLCAFDAAISQDDQTSRERAADLYRGPLLEGCGEVWVLAEREARKRSVLNVLDKLARQAYDQNNPERALHWRRRAVEIDPYSGESMRGLMRALAKTGDLAAALEAYQAFRRFIARDDPRRLPCAETSRLYHSLRDRLRTMSKQARSSTGAGNSACCTALQILMLPKPLTGLVGREREIGAVIALFEKGRLATLTGPGGIGKTRLALAIAEEMREELRDGVCFVDLAPIADPALVAPAVAAVLGIREEPGRPMLRTLAEALRDRDLLIVVDNCEHLLDPSAVLIHALLTSCPILRVLATSREPLDLFGEKIWSVPSLPYPEERAMWSSPSSLLDRYSSVQLFGNRVEDRYAPFGLTDDNAIHIAAICRSLEGVPLALELAAARVPDLTVAEIAAGLADRLYLLTQGSRAAPQRQKTLRAAIDWSCDLLSPPERTLFYRLSVFVGGCTLSAAEDVCAGGAVESGCVPELLANLARKSLVSRDGDRYRLLETIRQYGAEHLEMSGEPVAGRQRDYYLRLAKETSGVWSDAQYVRWSEAEQDNLRAVLSYCLSTPDGASAAMMLSVKLFDFWISHGYHSEGRIWLDSALAMDCQDIHARMLALQAAVRLAVAQNDVRGGTRAMAEECLALARDAGDQKQVLNVLQIMGFVLENFDEVWPYIAERIEICRRRGGPELSHALSDLAMKLMLTDKWRDASPVLDEALEVAQRCGDPNGQIKFIKSGMARLAWYRGDDARADILYGESLAAPWDESTHLSRAFMLWDSARTKLRLGQHNPARALLLEALPIFKRAGNKIFVALLLGGAVALAIHDQCAVRATRLLAAQEALFKLYGDETAAIDASPIPDLRATLGEEAFSISWSEGQKMTVDQAADYALLM